jgi:hypothetical protein
MPQPSSPSREDPRYLTADMLAQMIRELLTADVPSAVTSITPGDLTVVDFTHGQRFVIAVHEVPLGPDPLPMPTWGEPHRGD